MKHILKLILIGNLLLLPTAFVTAQCKFFGEILDKKKEPIISAQVIIFNPKNNQIVTFATSNSEGKFYLASIPLDTILIKINHISYTTYEEVIICNTGSQKRFILDDYSYQLQELIIKNKKVEKRGDTIIYDVRGLRDVHDNNLEDIIRKIPYIEIGNSGEIYYKGLAISKFMINNLDLLEGRYTLATKNLNPDQVNDIEVLENHQQIKLLQGISSPDNAAINLKLKSTVVFTGTSHNALGATPLLYMTNEDVFAFFKSKQGHIKFSANNIGSAISAEFKNHYDASEFASLTVDYLKITRPQLPFIDPERYTFNKEITGSLSALKKISNNLEIKFQGDISTDVSMLAGISLTNYITIGKNIKFTQQLNSITAPLNIQTQAIIEHNASKFHTKGTFKFRKSNIGSVGNHLINDIKILEDLEHNTQIISGDFNHMIKINNKAYRFNTDFNFQDNVQNMIVSPSNFYTLDSVYQYNNTIQNAMQQKSFFRVRAGRNQKIKATNFQLFWGAHHKRNSLSTELQTQPNESLLFANQLKHSELKFYFNNEVKFSKNSWTLNINTPIEFINANIKAVDNRMVSDIKGIFGIPKLGVKYKLIGDLSLLSSLSYGTKVNNLTRINDDFVLSKYQNLTRGNANLFRQTQTDYQFGLNKIQSSNMTFQSLTFSYTETKQNFIPSISVNNSGINASLVNEDQLIKSYTINTENRLNLLGLNGVNIRLAYGKQSFIQILNGVRTKINMDQASAKLKFAHYVKKVSFKNMLAYEYNYSGINSTSFLFSYDLDLSFLLSNKISLSLNENLIKNGLNENSNLLNFCNIQLSYAKPKSKSKVKIDFLNIFNQQSGIDVPVSKSNRTNDTKAKRKRDSDSEFDRIDVKKVNLQNEKRK